MTKQYRLLDEYSLLHPAERPHLAILAFGLAWGTIWALIVVVLTAIGISDTESNKASMSFLMFLAAVYPGHSPPFTAIDLFLGLVGGFFHGFLFGTLVAVLYNIWRGEQPFGVKLPRDFTSSSRPYVISAGKGAAPYTVAIIANPVLESETTGKLKRDPILNYPKLFQAKTACIIAGFATDPVMNEREADETFLDRMRLVTLFNPSLAKSEFKIGHHPPVEQPREHALCREMDYDIVVEPIQRLYEKNTQKVQEERLLNFIKQHLPAYYDHANNRSLIDVVYIVTASKTHTRSSARFTFDDEKNPGRGFTLDFGDEKLELRHDPYAKIPGVVAYSAWDNRLKTPIHEFAHAMSSTTNGAIIDEYYDDLPELLRNVRAINKHHWQPQEGQPLPEKFADYIRTDENPDAIRTDRGRHAPPEWKTYVPARENIALPCTMDFAEESFAFDLLIKKYMHDRLEAKTNRA
jgi:hypothetical protein